MGAAVVLLLLFALCLRTLRTGLRCPDALGCNICVGIFAALFLQCVINIGMNLQVLPVIGVTLPFFSAGGSSVVMMYLCVGIVLSVGMNTRRSKLEMQQILYKTAGVRCGTRCLPLRVTPHSVGERASDRVRPEGSARRWGEPRHWQKPSLLYSAALGSAINSPGIRQSDDSPTMMNTVRDSQLMLPPSSHPTALNPQMP